jgi:hypothetical protein
MFVGAFHWPSNHQNRQRQLVQASDPGRSQLRSCYWAEARMKLPPPSPDGSLSDLVGRRQAGVVPLDCQTCQRSAGHSPHVCVPLVHLCRNCCDQRLLGEGGGVGGASLHAVHVPQPLMVGLAKGK